MTDTCADCGKPGFKDTTGALKHDQRAVVGAAPDGKERRAPAATVSDPRPEKPPIRAHWIHKKWFGFGPQS